VVFQILVRNQFFVGGNGNKKKKKASLYKLFGTHPKKSRRSSAWGGSWGAQNKGIKIMNKYLAFGHIQKKTNCPFASNFPSSSGLPPPLISGITGVPRSRPELCRPAALPHFGGSHPVDGVQKVLPLPDRDIAFVPGALRDGKWVQ